MPAHTLAAAHSSLFIVWVFYFNLISFCSANGQSDILNIAVFLEVSVTAEFIRSHRIPADITRSPGTPV